MIVPPAGVRVLVAIRPVDFRKGMDGLAALAQETLGQDPFSGTVLVFRAKRANQASFSIPFAICRGGVSLASASR
jgi:transposase